MKRHAPATARNRDPIADVLRRELPQQGRVLEIASGSGEHIVHFAALFPNLVWQPSDPDPDAIASIRAWRDESQDAGSLLEPVLLDAAGDDWPVGPFDAILCINMIHISPWTATLGLLRGASSRLPQGAPLILYGPYRRDSVPTAPSNEAFDQSLKARNPAWGLRRIEDVAEIAANHGLRLDRIVEMPANNLTLVFRRT